MLSHRKQNFIINMACEVVFMSFSAFIHPDASKHVSEWKRYVYLLLRELTIKELLCSRLVVK